MLIKATRVPRGKGRFFSTLKIQPGQVCPGCGFRWILGPSAGIDFSEADFSVLEEAGIVRVRLAVGGRMEMQFVLPQQLPESAAVFAGRLGRARDVALMVGQETLEIILFKIQDDA